MTKRLPVRGLVGHARQEQAPLRFKAMPLCVQEHAPCAQEHTPPTSKTCPPMSRTYPPAMPPPAQVLVTYSTLQGHAPMGYLGQDVELLHDSTSRAFVFNGCREWKVFARASLPYQPRLPCRSTWE